MHTTGLKVMRIFVHSLTVCPMHPMICSTILFPSSNVEHCTGNDVKSAKKEDHMTQKEVCICGRGWSSKITWSHVVHIISSLTLQYQHQVYPNNCIFYHLKFQSRSKILLLQDQIGKKLPFHNRGYPFDVALNIFCIITCYLGACVMKE